MNFAGKQINKSKSGAIFITLSLTCKSNLRSASEDSRLDAKLKYQITTPARGKKYGKDILITQYPASEDVCIKHSKKEISYRDQSHWKTMKTGKRRESFGKEARGNKAAALDRRGFYCEKTLPWRTHRTIKHLSWFSWRKSVMSEGRKREKRIFKARITKSLFQSKFNSETEARQCQRLITEQ